MKLLENMVVALAMYSKIPMPQIEWNKENMRYALCFFPVVGIAVGILCNLWFDVAALSGIGTILKTAVFLLIPVLVTGGIHLDGLLDTADALSSWQPQERRLEILKDSHAGAFAIIVCCSYFLAAFGIWSEMDVSSIRVLGIGFVLSRALSGIGISTFHCAKNSGLAATFANAADRKRTRIILIVEAVVASVWMLLSDVKRGSLAIAAALVVFFLCRRMAYRKFGGITGDIQGFFLQMCELVMAYGVILGGRT